MLFSFLYYSCFFLLISRLVLVLNVGWGSCVLYVVCPWQAGEGGKGKGVCMYISFGILDLCVHGARWGYEGCFLLGISRIDFFSFRFGPFRRTSLFPAVIFFVFISFFLDFSPLLRVPRGCCCRARDRVDGQISPNQSEIGRLMDIVLLS
jgi:hypothetical protein